MKRINLFNEDISKRSDLGNKVKNLSILFHNGIKVPMGFALNNQFYNEFLESIKSDLLKIINTKNSTEISSNVKELFLSTALNGLNDSLNEALDYFNDDVYFAVRSSGYAFSNGNLVAEDSNKNSLAGQYDSFLKVPKKNIEDAIKLCWASLYNYRSLKSFNQKSNKDYIKSGMSVIVQEMIPANYSAVMMTKDPLEKENVLGIESTYGPCEAIVSGKVTGDFILYDKKSKNIIEKEKGSKKHRINYLEFSKNNEDNYKLISNSDELKNSYALNEEKIKNLINVGLKIENIFKKPQDIEAVFFNDELYVVQTRDITTLNGGK